MKMQKKKYNNLRWKDENESRSSYSICSWLIVICRRKVEYLICICKLLNDFVQLPKIKYSKQSLHNQISERRVSLFFTSLPRILLFFSFELWNDESHNIQIWFIANLMVKFVTIFAFSDCKWILVSLWIITKFQNPTNLK